MTFFWKNAADASSIGEAREHLDSVRGLAEKTVNEVRDEEEGTHFSVNIIPHTAQETTLGVVTRFQVRLPGSMRSGL